MKAFLDKSPKDELFDAAQLARNIGSSVNVVRDVGKSLEGYTERYSRSRLYGHPAAIALFRRERGAK